jgi:hypothetical protein
MRGLRALDVAFTAEEAMLWILARCPGASTLIDAVRRLRSQSRAAMSG